MILQKESNIFSIYVIIDMLSKSGKAADTNIPLV